MEEKKNILYIFTSRLLLLLFGFLLVPLIGITSILFLSVVSNTHTSQVLGASSCGCYINGFAFMDTNKNGIYDKAEEYFQSTPLTFSLYDSHGNLVANQTQNSFNFNQVKANKTYIINLNTIPQGYVLTTPQTFTVTVGTNCTVNNSNAICTQQGNVEDVAFGLNPAKTQPLSTSTQTSTYSPPSSPQQRNQSNQRVHASSRDDQLQVTTPTLTYTVTPVPAQTIPLQASYLNNPFPTAQGTTAVPIQDTPDQAFTNTNDTTDTTPVQNRIITLNQPTVTPPQPVQQQYSATVSNPPTQPSVEHVESTQQSGISHTQFVTPITSVPGTAQPNNPISQTQPIPSTSVVHPVSQIPNIPALPSNTDFGVFSIPDKSVLGGIVTLQIKNNTDAAIELELLPLTGIPDSVFLGRGVLDGLHHLTDIQWDTRNTPNGIYDLYAKIYKSDQATELVNPVEVTIHNKQTADNNSPATLVSASHFNPATVPVDTNTAVTQIQNSVSSSTHNLALTFEGRSQPNSFVTILIYSEPIMATVLTNENGEWSYTLDKPLPPGNHSSYVVFQNNGTTIRSNVTQFAIASASGEKESLILASVNQKIKQQNYFLIIGFSLLGVVILIGLFFMKEIFGRNLQEDEKTEKTF